MNVDRFWIFEKSAWVLAAWGILFAEFQPAALQWSLILFPWLLILCLAVSKGSIGFERLQPGQNDVSDTCLLIGLVITWRALLDYDIFEATQTLLPVASYTVIWVAAILFARMKPIHPRKSLVLPILTGVLIGYGSCLLLNDMLDRASPIVIDSTVKNMLPNRSKKYGHYVEVSGTPELAESLEVKVSKQRYESLKLGDRIQVSVHPGALGIQWLSTEAHR